MLKTNKHIEIVRSSNKALSSLSEESCIAIMRVLAKNYSKVGVSIVDKLSDLDSLIKNSPDLVFLGMKYVPNDITKPISDDNITWLSDYFDVHDIAYTGSGSLAHKRELNKPLAKQLAHDANLNTPAYKLLKYSKPVSEAELTLKYPVFIKPSNSGGGVGIDCNSVVQNFDELIEQVKSLNGHIKSDLLVEEYLSGREFSVAIIKDEYSPNYQVLPIELIAPADQFGKRILSRSVKSSNAEQALKVSDSHINYEVAKLALAVFNVLGGQDYGRIDIRLDANEIPHFLEANLLPSLISGYGSFPKACALIIGLDYESMIIRIVNLGLKRSLSYESNELDATATNLLTPVDVVFETI